MANLGGIIKSIRNLMRGDKGINGDAQRIEQMGWMIFLKIFDDKDIEMELLNDDYVSPIESDLQWRNWAADDDTGKSTSMNNVTRGQLVNLPIPVPPIEEQKAIIVKIEHLGTYCDQLYQQVIQSQITAEQLMQAILREAFTMS